MEYLKPKFTIGQPHEGGRAAETVTCCERCVYNRGEHAPHCVKFLAPLGFEPFSDPWLEDLIASEMDARDLFVSAAAMDGGSADGPGI